VGRRSTNDLVLHDKNVSGLHFRIFSEPNGFMIEDVGSTNGTFVNGTPITSPTPLLKSNVIRAGQNVLVFEPDASLLFETPPFERYGMDGSFHIASLVGTLKEAVMDGRHILVVGQTGVGKELAAHAIVAMTLKSGGAVSLLEHNCAQYTSEGEANASLFGVGARVFSEVERRSGLIEQAGDGILFLDEANCLPARIQKSLLRLIENQQYRRIGESQIRVCNARMIFASNDVEHPTAGLLHDLYPRLRVVRVPCLKERVADIPGIFLRILKKSLKDACVHESHYTDYLTGRHFELLCLAGLEVSNIKGFEDNVRGLKDIAKRLAAKAAVGKNPGEAVNDVFYDRFSSEIAPLAHRCTPQKECENAASSSSPGAITGVSSHYEKYKDLIVETYHDREMRLAPTVRTLKTMGVSCTRQHLSRYLKKWGIRE
jgi:transcriptional regulator with AAA-type ATPase domain